jgi:hypothetical protein
MSLPQTAEPRRIVKKSAIRSGFVSNEAYAQDQPYFLSKASCLKSDATTRWFVPGVALTISAEELTSLDALNFLDLLIQIASLQHMYL